MTRTSFGQQHSAQTPAITAIKMSADEWRASLSLGLVYAVRMWGLFLLLPVFAIHAQALEDGTPLLIGLALGVYGITQALLQVPFGRASDRFGRKPVITVGLLLLAVGSVVAALATSVAGVIIGRAIQGCGAVAAAIMALSTDLTREENRAKAMATIGISIGTSVMLAFMVAPALAASIGVTGIFWLIAILALVAIGLVWRVVPPEPVASRKLPPAPEALRRALSNRHIVVVLLGIFTIHALLMALFVSVPVLLVERLQLPLSEHWKIYVPTLLAAVPMLGVVGRSMKSGAASRIILLAGAIFIVCAFLLMSINGGWWIIVPGMWLFFCGFNGLEAALPSLVSRLAPAGTKGTTLGLFSTCQFLGVFVGGLLGGGLLGAIGASGVFLVCALSTAGWAVLIWRAGPAPLASSVELVTESMTEADAESLRQQLSGYHGVVDVTVLAAAGVAYLSVSDGFDKKSLEHLVRARE